MGDRRKLQGEIDRCIKKVNEGVEQFEDIWQKVYSATNTSQKEKHETDLKKEIKKLQRLRDQIKTWMASSEIKDKQALIDNRKLIETQMERFKIVERETKTKAYSKEGLGGAPKVDPAQKEKEDITNWLATSIDSLNIHVDQFECEIESLMIGAKKKKNDNQDRVDELKCLLERHRYHILQLETVMRALDNDTVEIDKIRTIKEDIENYIESCQEPDFVENEYIYDDLDLQDMADYLSKGSASAIDLGAAGQLSALQNPTEVANPADLPMSEIVDDARDSGESRIEPSNISISYGTANPVLGSADITSSPQKIQECSVFSEGGPCDPCHSEEAPTRENKATKVPVGSHVPVTASTKQSSNPPVERQSSRDSTIPLPHCGAPNVGSLRDSSLESHSPPRAAPAARTSHAPPQTHRVLNTVPSSAKQHAKNLKQQRTSTPQHSEEDVLDAVLSCSPLGIHEESSLHSTRNNDDAKPCSSEVQAGASTRTGSIQDGVSSAPLSTLYSLATQAANRESLGTRTAALSEHLPDRGEMVVQPIKPQLMGFSAGLPSRLQPTQTQPPASYNQGLFGGLSWYDLSHASSAAKGMIASSRQSGQRSATTEAHIPPLLGIAPLGTVPLSKECCHQLRMLDAASMHMPHPSDSESIRIYTTRHQCAVPSCYPISWPRGNTIELFQRIPTEALFFAFYYMEGTRAQYMAAKVLKKRAWRFHTKYMMWFQRHEEPKTITDEYEQGTYIYFDYETWTEKRREGFTFEYEFLEDRDLN
ncbi:CCR4-NOT transcription complex subunit 3-like isoform X2 [Ornithodoros turicata]|uniref:CCR4-NOT transcription complex subunit 3-like isoform X2 n=1 Tax=Ornithodoros turicata TaxID=34597 RepID=UPI003138736F